jgi:hypothetical protein
MILLDSDVLIDLLRKHPPATAWFDAMWVWPRAMCVITVALGLPAYVHTRLGGLCENRWHHLAAQYR